MKAPGNRQQSRHSLDMGEKGIDVWSSIDNYSILAPACKIYISHVKPTIHITLHVCLGQYISCIIYHSGKRIHFCLSDRYYIVFFLKSHISLTIRFMLISLNLSLVSAR